MNPINRAGQKVLCVLSENEWRSNVCSQLSKIPGEGQVYTVKSFHDTSYGAPGIHLIEIPGYRCECLGVIDGSWDIRGFKPVRNGTEDIGAFVKIALDVTERKTAPKTKRKKADA